MMEALWNFLEQQQSNDFLVGGAALAAVGLLGAAAHRAQALARRVFWRAFAWSVTIENRHEAYGRMLQWLAAEGAFRRMKSFRLDQFEPARRGDDEDEDDAQAGPKPVLTPDAGLAWVMRDGALVLIERRIDDKPIPGRRDRMESLRLTFVTPGRGRGPALFERWRRAADAFARDPKAGWPRLYTLAGWGGWDSAGRVRPRPLASVVTRGDQGARLVADARAFLAREQWYAERGVPWRRGYLLYGPPGTGKTSLIRAVAGAVGLDLAIVDLSGKTLDDAGLRAAVASAPRRAALVLEDVDAAFRGRARDEASGGITFSGLLNALDGLAAQEGRIVFMTTNHREALDPALIRPGRADLHLELGLIGPAEAAALFARFFPGEAPRAARLGAALSGALSPAAAQAALLSAADDPEAAEAALAAAFAAQAEAAAHRIAAE